MSLKNNLLVEISKSYRTTDKPVTLSSKIQTTEYLDCREALSYPPTLQLASEAIYEELKSYGSVEAIGGMTMGADPLAVSLSLESLRKADTLRWFSVRKNLKDYGMKRRIEGFCQPGTKGVLLDDVVTTGNSLALAFDYCSEAGMEIIGAIGLVNRGGLPEIKGIKTTYILDFSDVSLVGSAREFAIKAHGAQMYGKYPYLVHLDEVVKILSNELPYCPTLLAAGYLHDVLEDTPTTEEELFQITSGRVCRIVNACTDGEGDNRKERKERPYGLIPTRTNAVLVKLADRIANVENCRREDNIRLFEMYRKEHDMFTQRLLASPTTAEFKTGPLWHRLERAFK